MSASSSQYLQALGSAEFKMTVKGSKFLAFAAPASDVAAAEAIIRDRARRHHDATHNCWAYRTGEPAPLMERSSDAGEPSGTAGRPILEVLRRGNLVGVVLIVSRWFGGTKLGKGGLARAYADCAAGVIALLETEARLPMAIVTIECGYHQIGLVERIAIAVGGRIVSAEHGALARLQISVPIGNRKDFASRIAESSSATIVVPD